MPIRPAGFFFYNAFLRFHGKLELSDANKGPYIKPFSNTYMKLWNGLAFASTSAKGRGGHFDSYLGIHSSYKSIY